MRVRIQFPGALTSALLLAGIVGCSTVMSQSSDELLTNVSFHILVNEAEPIPSSGTYEIDTKLFKIDENLDLDLASIEQRVSRALLCGFEGKGLRQATENPDLIVNYAVAVDAELTAADLNEAFSSETPINFPEPEGDQDLSYRKGVLILDIVDANR